MSSKIKELVVSFLFFSSIIYGQSAFVDVTNSSGFVHNYDGYRYGGGVACADFNGDNYLDLFVPNGLGLRNLLCLNNGDGTFEEVGESAGLTDTASSVGVVCADIDNDGDLDIYVTNFESENKLYLNDGFANFVDVTKSAGVGDPGPGSSVAMADYNNDGFLDIYVLNRSLVYPSVFYQNQGDGTFVDVAGPTGTRIVGTFLGVSFFDYDNDRDLDLIAIGEYERDQLFRNEGNGTFTNVSMSAGMLTTYGMGLDFIDYNEDGFFDIHIADYSRDYFLRNNTDGTFTNIAVEIGVANPGVGWGVNFMDYDNDGDKDLYVINGPMTGLAKEAPNVFYRNDGTGHFIEETQKVGLSYTGDGRGSVCADFNRDGYLDLFMVYVLRGQSRLLLNSGGTNNWIVLKLVGTRSNRSAIGAKVLVKAGNLKQIDEVRAGSSYASMHPLELEFGLGHQLINLIDIQWPSGIQQRLENVDVNQVLTITEPVNTANNDNLPLTVQLRQNYPNPFNDGTGISYWLPEVGEAELKITNIAGQIIMSHYLGEKPAGNNLEVWSGEDKNGRSVASGIYFYQVVSRSKSGVFRSELKKMLKIK